MRSWIARLVWCGLLPFAVVVGATVLSPTRSQAQDYPWCAQYSGDMSGARNCGFVNFDQCMLTIRGMGGFCVPNTLYVPPGAAPSRARRAPWQ